MKKYCQNIIPALFIIILLLIWEAAVGFSIFLCMCFHHRYR